MEGWEREGGGTDRLEDTAEGGRKGHNCEHNRRRWGAKPPGQRGRAAQGHARASQQPWGSFGGAERVQESRGRAYTSRAPGGGPRPHAAGPG